MKMVLPKELIDLSAAIARKQGECDAIRADLERAAIASTAAEEITAELAALSQRRAELKAQAFISRQPADLTELDAKEEKLERASRSAREDGTAAAIAITLLNSQLEEAEIAIQQITEQRRELALKWLEDRRERALDRYVKALNDLGPIIAEAGAADLARGPLGDFNRRPGSWLLAEWRTTPLPIPGSHMEYWDANRERPKMPIAWRRDIKHGVTEHDSLLVLFREAGLLPPLAAAAIEETATDDAA